VTAQIWGERFRGIENTDARGWFYPSGGGEESSFWQQRSGGTPQRTFLLYACLALSQDAIDGFCEARRADAMWDVISEQINSARFVGHPFSLIETSEGFGELGAKNNLIGY
jgi:hypothetical protein